MKLQNSGFLKFAGSKIARSMQCRASGTYSANKQKLHETPEASWKLGLKGGNFPVAELETKRGFPTCRPIPLHAMAPSSGGLKDQFRRQMQQMQKILEEHPCLGMQGYRWRRAGGRRLKSLATGSRLCI